jgi:hypothetical protein
VVPSEDGQVVPSEDGQVVPSEDEQVVPKHVDVLSLNKLKVIMKCIKLALFIKLIPYRLHT